MNYQSASEYAIGRLRRELPGIFLYHSIRHTRAVTAAVSKALKRSREVAISSN